MQQQGLQPQEGVTVTRVHHIWPSGRCEHRSLSLTLFSSAGKLQHSIQAQLSLETMMRVRGCGGAHR